MTIWMKEASLYFTLKVFLCGLLMLQLLQRKGTRRTATIAVPPLAAGAERGRGGAETETDAAEIGVGTAKSADTDAG